MSIRAFLPVPHSTLGLTLTGFVLVALPLIVAVAAGVARMDRVAESSYAAAIRSSEVGQHGRALVDHLLAMERSLGQYRVFREAGFYETYQNRRAALHRSLAGLAALELGEAFQSRLQALAALEAQQNQHVERRAYADAEDLWESLSADARAVDKLGRELAETEIDAAAASARDGQRLLLIQTAAVLPVSMLMAVLFAFLIMRPIKQVDGAIRRLAADSFGEPVEIQGPRDLEEVGECLDALRRKVIALERGKFGFLRRISHELKTPLTAIRQGAELLADKSGTSEEETMEIGEMLKDSSLELQRLIEDLLEFGRTQRLAQMPAATATIDVLEVVKRVLASHALTLRSRRITLETDLSEAMVVGDAMQLQTVVNNLVANAVKYTPGGGTIRVALGSHNDDREVAIDVHDSGPGISPADRAHVFEPFFQGSPAPGSHVKGTGLGLAIAREYAEAHHGVIEIIDADRGAHFRVRLPKAPG